MDPSDHRPAREMGCGASSCWSAPKASAVEHGQTQHLFYALILVEFGGRASALRWTLPPCCAATCFSPEHSPTAQRFRCIRFPYPGAGILLLKMSRCSFHCPPSRFQMTMYLPLSSSSPPSP
jgi:hypothetical protein